MLMGVAYVYRGACPCEARGIPPEAHSVSDFTSHRQRPVLFLGLRILENMRQRQTTPFSTGRHRRQTLASFKDSLLCGKARGKDRESSWGSIPLSFRPRQQWKADKPATWCFKRPWLLVTLKSACVNALYPHLKLLLIVVESRKGDGSVEINS